MALRHDDIFPIDHSKGYSEEVLFDLIEFLFDHVARPLEEGSYYHDWNGCGTHYQSFSRPKGQDEFREKVNLVLRDYGEGWELSETGEIQSCADQGMEALLSAPLPILDDKNVNKRVDAAISKFRRRSSTADDRRDAVRDLADVLEFLRKDLKKVLTTKDENDLFQLANQFGVRHHNGNQQTNYDIPIWLSWMFYYYLATIHAAVRLIKKGPAIP